jgi:hypothetical protein
VSYDDERADRACAELTKFGDHYVNADFPNWYYQIAVAGRMVALLKKETAEGEEPEARPIGCGNIVRRLIHGVLANDFAGPAAKAFAPYQVAIDTTGASHQLCFGMRELVERFPELALYKLDLDNNAFNRFHRCEVGELSERCYEVKPLRLLHGQVPRSNSATSARWCGGWRPLRTLWLCERRATGRPFDRAILLPLVPQPPQICAKVSARRGSSAVRARAPAGYCRQRSVSS